MKVINAKTIGLLILTIFIFSINLCLQAKVTAQEFTTEVITRPDIKYAAEGLRDPFESYIKEEEEEEEIVEVLEVQEAVPLAPPPLEIQGIVWGGSIPQAIINHKVVKIGDVIEEAEIIKIDKEGIIVLYKGKEFNLSSPAKGNLENLKKLEKGGQDEEQF